MLALLELMDFACSVTESTLWREYCSCGVAGVQHFVFQTCASRPTKSHSLGVILTPGAFTFSTRFIPTLCSTYLYWSCGNLTPSLAWCWPWQLCASSQYLGLSLKLGQPYLHDMIFFCISKKTLLCFSVCLLLIVAGRCRIPDPCTAPLSMIFSVSTLKGPIMGKEVIAHVAAGVYNFTTSYHWCISKVKKKMTKNQLEWLLLQIMKFYA
jgi:hypothetical protein